MYQILGVRLLLRAYATLAGLVTIVVLIIKLAMLDSIPTTMFEILMYLGTPLSTGMTIAALVVWVLGETKVFSWLCRVQPLSHVLPDLDGGWEGSLYSNWPQIEARLPGRTTVVPAGATTTIPAKASIKVRLSSVSMVLESTSRYSRSETILVGVERRAVSDAVRLIYVYDNRTAQPEQTDEQGHLGAAVLELVERDGAQVLEGVYWTNRNWSKGLNTAGRVSLHRIRDGGAPWTERGGPAPE